jgi:hypothetical protein
MLDWQGRRVLRPPSSSVGLKSSSSVGFNKSARERRVVPVLARLRAKLVGNRALFDCASEVVVVAPAVDRVHPAPIALPGEFDRVLAMQEETTIALELERLAAGPRRHPETIAYRIDNAVLGNGSLYYNDGYQVIRGRSARPLLPRAQDRFEEIQLCTNYVIDRYFGHWLTDGLNLELLAEQRSVPALTLAGNPWPHEAGYRELLGLKAARSANARVDRLWVIDDRAFNDGWISRFEALRQRLRSVRTRNGAKRVMLTRGKLGVKRNLVNSGEVHEALVRLGFEIVNPESDTPRKIVETLTGAEFVIAVEGSAQHHCWVTMAPRSTFLAIQPPTRFGAIGKAYADAIGVNWAYVVADRHADGFYLPVGRLLQTLDEVARVIGIRL